MTVCKDLETLMKELDLTQEQLVTILLYTKDLFPQFKTANENLRKCTMPAMITTAVNVLKTQGQIQDYARMMNYPITEDVAEQLATQFVCGSHCKQQKLDILHKFVDEFIQLWGKEAESQPEIKATRLEKHPPLQKLVQ